MLNKKLRKILEDVSPMLIIYGVLFVALCADGYTNGELSLMEYVSLSLKVFIPGFIGILIQGMLYIDQLKSKKAVKTIIVYDSKNKNPKTIENSDESFSRIMNVLNSVNKN